MKFLSVVFAMVISANLFASDTSISITPFEPSDCTKNQVNWIYNVEKVSESNESVTFSFLTKYGTCNNNRIQAEEIRLEKGVVSAVRQGFVLPWKNAVNVEVKHYSAVNEAFVLLTFDKTVLFKKKSTAFYVLTFSPNYHSKAPWKIKLATSKDNTVQILWKFAQLS